MAKQAIPKMLHCVGCGRPCDKMNFYPNANKHLKKYNFGRHQYCKKCCKEISQSIMDEHENFEAGIREICTLFTIPYIDDVMTELQKEYNSKTREVDWNWVYQYQEIMKNLKLNTTSVWNNLTGNSIYNFEIYKKLSKEEFETIQQLTNDWGEHSYEVWEDLEYRWRKYTDGLKLTTAQATLYRHLCYNEWLKRQKEKQGVDGESTKPEQDAILKLMNKLKIDNFETNDKSTVEKLLESRIALVEETEPAEYYEDLTKFKDYLGIEEYMENNIKRPFRNKLLNSKEYDILNEILDGDKK